MIFNFFAAKALRREDFKIENFIGTVSSLSRRKFFSAKQFRKLSVMYHPSAKEGGQEPARAGTDGGEANP